MCAQMEGIRATVKGRNIPLKRGRERPLSTLLNSAGQKRPSARQVGERCINRQTMHIFKTLHLKSIFSNCIITKEPLNLSR